MNLNDVDTIKLTTLANFLMKVPEHRFDLGSWGKETFLQKISFGTCGFAGCAMGWAGYAQLFPNFVYNFYYKDVYYEDAVLGRVYGFKGIALLFGINNRTADYFFYGPKYDSKYESFDYDTGKYMYSIPPKVVAERINRFVEIVERRKARARRKAIIVGLKQLPTIVQDWMEMPIVKDKLHQKA